MILVTGATGFIGNSFAQGLISKGHKVRIVCRDAEKARSMFPAAEIFECDLARSETLRGVGTGIGTVVHLAGMISYSRPRGELFSANADTTRNLLEECRDVGRIIFSSSVGVYGKMKGVADEGYPTGPENPYGESKLEAERLIQESGIPHVILRIAPVYGKGSPSWMKALRLLDKGFPIPKTKNLTHVIHVSDVVQALEKSLKKGKGVYNIADREPIPFMDFAEAIVRQMGKKPRKMPMFLARGFAKAAGMGAYFDVLTANRNYSIEKAGKELEYKPCADFNKELREMIEWYKVQ